MKKFTIGIMLGTVTVVILAFVDIDSLMRVYIAFAVAVIGWIFYDLMKD